MVPFSSSLASEPFSHHHISHERVKFGTVWFANHAIEGWVGVIANTDHANILYISILTVSIRRRWDIDLIMVWTITSNVYISYYFLIPLFSHKYINFSIILIKIHTFLLAKVKIYIYILLLEICPPYVDSINQKLISEKEPLAIAIKENRIFWASSIFSLHLNYGHRHPTRRPHRWW
jgi:hypothetical protein